MYYSTKEAFDRMRSLRTDVITSTKTAFDELGYYKPKHPEDGITEFADNEMHEAVSGFQRDKGLQVDGRIRVGGPTQHRVNAEIHKKRQGVAQKGRAQGLGLRSSVGRNGINDPSDVKKTKRALSAIDLYPKEKQRLNSGKPDRSLQFGLDILSRKYGIGMKNGRLDGKSAAEKEVYALASGNDAKFAGLLAKPPKTKKSKRKPGQMPPYFPDPDEQPKPGGILGVLNELAGIENGLTGGDEDVPPDFFNMEKGKQNKILQYIGAATDELKKANDANGVSGGKGAAAEAAFFQQLGSIAGGLLQNAGKSPESDEGDRGGAGGAIDEALATNNHADEIDVDRGQASSGGGGGSDDDDGDSDFGIFSGAHAAEPEPGDDPNAPAHNSPNNSDAEPSTEAAEESSNNYVEFPPSELTGSNSDAIDYGFIVPREKGEGGKYTTKPFWPGNEKSGTTFTGGLDVGQIDKAEAKKLTADIPGLYEKIEDYVGIKGEESQKLIDEKGGPNVTVKELSTMTTRKYDQIFDEVKAKYDAKNGKGSFDELKKPMKTVIISVATQYGANLPEKTPKFWQHASNKDVDSMIKELKDFKDKYPSRRKIEATYLEERMAN